MDTNQISRLIMTRSHKRVTPAGVNSPPCGFGRIYLK